jgi:hypothetical protein
MSQQKYQSLVTKENIDYSLSKLKDEDEKKDFMNVISKVDIKIDTKPVIEGNETCYNILIRERNTKRRKHFQICRLEFRKRKKMEIIPNLIDILNEIRRWLDLPDECRECCYEILPKESANKYSMLPLDWKRLFPDS